MTTTHYRDIRPYPTRDGSEIRELMHPSVHGNRNQSFAEARIEPGMQTRLHRHGKSEEIYHVTTGHGCMTLGEREFEINTGDTICIAPGTPHCVRNPSETVLVILCACSPAYAHDDTELL